MRGGTETVCQPTAAMSSRRHFWIGPYDYYPSTVTRERSSKAHAPRLPNLTWETRRDRFSHLSLWARKISRPLDLRSLVAAVGAECCLARSSRIGTEKGLLRVDELSDYSLFIAVGDHRSDGVPVLAKAVAGQLHPGDLINFAQAQTHVKVLASVGNLGVITGSGAAKRIQHEGGHVGVAVDRVSSQGDDGIDREEMIGLGELRNLPIRVLEQRLYSLHVGAPCRARKGGGFRVADEPTPRPAQPGRDVFDLVAARSRNSATCSSTLSTHEIRCAGTSYSVRQRATPPHRVVCRKASAGHTSVHQIDGLFDRGRPVDPDTRMREEAAREDRQRDNGPSDVKGHQIRC